jgi:hypothetical protein
MKQLENIAVKIDGKEQWEQVAAVLEGYGIKKDPDPKWSDWDLRLHHGRKNIQVKVHFRDGYGLRESRNYDFTFTDFMQQFGNPQPDPIAELTKRIEALEARVFGNTEQAQPAPAPEPETVYDGVFWFDASGAHCFNRNQAINYKRLVKEWTVSGYENQTKPHRLVQVNEFTVGKWYASGDGDYTTQYEYLMYLGDDKFTGWSGHPNHPIIICNQENGEVQLLEVQPA